MLIEVDGWVFCCGARRSGSTLQYNIASEIVEQMNCGKRIEFTPPEKFSLIKEKYKGYRGYKVFKTHVLTPLIKKEFENDRAIGVYTYRDIRDVLVSLKYKNGGSISKLIKGNTVENYLSLYNDWMQVSNRLLISKYEDYVDNIIPEIIRMAKFLSLELDDQIVKIIAKKVIDDAPNNEKQIEKVSEAFFDSKTLLHINHIHSGECEQWKTELSPREIKLIEKKSMDWLYGNGYILDNKSFEKKVSLYSYSQHGEDCCVWEYLNRKKSGLIVEVGAFDGVHLSNSYALEKIGWKSICIEPHTDYFSLLQKNRPNSKNLNLAVVGESDKETIQFYQEKLGLLSGTCIDHQDVEKRYNNRRLKFEKPKVVNVKAKTLNSIFNEYKVSKHLIDCISIDVEGSEIDVLNGLDIEYYQPKIFIVEANTSVHEANLCNYFSHYVNYVNVGRFGANIIFIRGRIESLKKFKSSNKTCKKAIQIHPLGEKFTIQTSYQYHNVWKNHSRIRKIFRNIFNG